MGQKQTKQNILFRCDGGEGVGIGHVMRCMALAQAWRQMGAQVFFVSSQLPNSLKRKILQERIKLRMICDALGSEADAWRTVALADSLKAQVVILDGYRLHERYQEVVRRSHFLVVINDYGFLKRYAADVVLDYNLGASEDDYPRRKPDSILLLGKQYTLLRKEFLKWRSWHRKIRVDEPFRILISLGGSSQSKAIKKVMGALRLLHFEKLEICFLLGGDSVAEKNMASIVASLPFSFAFKQNVNDVTKYMVWADMAISGGGVTSWELACMGLPTLLLVCADNQKRGVAELSRRKIAWNLGPANDVQTRDLAQAITQLLSSPRMRREMSRKGRCLLDGLGAHRVVKRLTQLACNNQRKA